MDKGGGRRSVLRISGLQQDDRSKPSGGGNPERDDNPEQGDAGKTTTRWSVDQSAKSETIVADMEEAVRLDPDQGGKA